MPNKDYLPWDEYPVGTIVKTNIGVFHKSSAGWYNPVSYLFWWPRPRGEIIAVKLPMAENICKE